MNFLKLYENLTEDEAEAICKNIALALHMPNLAYYETGDWMEIIYKACCISLVLNSSNDKSKFKDLLYHAIWHLVDKKIITDFNKEYAMINVDLAKDNNL